VALISTNLSATATARWRLGTLESPSAAHDSGILPAHTGDEANGNVVLLRSGAATARYLLVDVADASLGVIDIGLLVAGPLWRLARGMAYGVREGRLIFDQRDRNPLTGAEFVSSCPRSPIRALPPSRYRRCRALRRQRRTGTWCGASARHATPFGSRRPATPGQRRTDARSGAR
jgi:hypothetical protein